MSLSRSFLLLPLVLFATTSDASAQLLRIQIKEDRQDKLEKYLTEWSGKKVIICEARDGSISLDEATKKWNYSPARNEVWIADSGDPELVPYKLRRGELVPTSKKWVLGINGQYIKSVGWFSRDGQTFGGLSEEYGIRSEIVDEIKRERDAEKKGSAEWFRRHMRFVSANTRLHKWLESTCYVKAAEKLAKAIKKEEKIIVKQAQEYRLRAAIESIHDIETPEDLIEASREITNGIQEFAVMESTHCRIVYVTGEQGLGEDQVRGLLELAETSIDGFKIEYVDPYMDAVTFTDNIPDGLCIEYFFGPLEHKRSYEEFLEVYYKRKWGKFRDKRLEGHMSRHRLLAPHRKLSYMTLGKSSDLEGIVTHHVGHALASFQYNAGGGFEQMAWLPEAVAYHVSLEMLGRNSTHCFTYREEDVRRYRQPPKESPDLEEGVKTAMRGTREVFNAMALEEGPKIEVLALKRLFELNNADLAKGWSFYDYLCRKKGKVGQEWLRAGARFSANRNKLVSDWREVSEDLFEIEGQDVFKVIDDAWRQFARTGQDTSGG